MVRILLLAFLLLSLSSFDGENGSFAELGQLCETHEDCFRYVCSSGPCPEDSNVPGQDNLCLICQ